MQVLNCWNADSLTFSPLTQSATEKNMISLTWFKYMISKTQGKERTDETRYMSALSLTKLSIFTVRNFIRQSLSCFAWLIIQTEVYYWEQDRNNSPAIHFKTITFYLLLSKTNSNSNTTHLPTSHFLKIDFISSIKPHFIAKSTINI